MKHNNKPGVAAVEMRGSEDDGDLVGRGQALNLLPRTGVGEVKGEERETSQQ